VIVTVNPQKFMNFYQAFLYITLRGNVSMMNDWKV